MAAANTQQSQVVNILITLEKSSAMQGISGYETDLPGSRSSNDINEAIMDISNDMYSEDNRNIRKEESSMISNLPLLFANGHPTSLEKITMVLYQLSYLIFCAQICIIFRDFCNLIH